MVFKSSDRRMALTLSPALLMAHSVTASLNSLLGNNFCRPELIPKYDFIVEFFCNADAYETETGKDCALIQVCLPQHPLRPFLSHASQQHGEIGVIHILPH